MSENNNAVLDSVKTEVKTEYGKFSGSRFVSIQGQLFDWLTDSCMQEEREAHKLALQLACDLGFLERQEFESIKLGKVGKSGDNDGKMTVQAILAKSKGITMTHSLRAYKLLLLSQDMKKLGAEVTVELPDVILNWMQPKKTEDSK